MAKKVTVTWIDSTGNTVAPTHHIVERKTGAGGTYSQISGNIANGTQTYDDTSALVDSTQYFYRVGAVFASGSTKYVEASITISGVNLLLDTYTGATVAFSLRRLKSSIVNVIRVRRASDNAELDFSESEINDGTLTAWTGANDAFVTKWYDQSGNNNHIVNIVNSEQPILVKAGVVHTVNGKPAVQFLGTANQHLGLVGFGAKLWLNYTGFLVYNTDDNTKNGTCGFSDQTLQGFYLNQGNNGGITSNVLDDRNSAILRLSSLSVLNKQYINTMIKRSNSDRELFINSASVDTNTTNAATATTLADMWIGRLRSSDVLVSTFSLHEWIFYESDKSTDRLAIESNINNAYTIF